MAAANLVALLANLFSKISVHTGGITGAAVVLILVFGPVALPSLAAIALVGWARIAIGKHTVGQVVAGVLVAGISTLVVFRLLGVS